MWLWIRPESFALRFFFLMGVGFWTRRLLWVGDEGQQAKAETKATAIFSRFGFAFAPAFGRAEAAFVAGWRREAEASLYLAATATACYNSKRDDDGNSKR
jgi:hypothetical protein